MYLHKTKTKTHKRGILHYLDVSHYSSLRCVCDVIVVICLCFCFVHVKNHFLLILVKSYVRIIYALLSKMGKNDNALCIYIIVCVFRKKKNNNTKLSFCSPILFYLLRAENSNGRFSQYTKIFLNK